MLTPLTEGTEERLEVGGLIVQTARDGALFQEPRINEWWKRTKRLWPGSEDTSHPRTLHNSGMEIDHLFSGVATRDRLPAPARCGVDPDRQDHPINGTVGTREATISATRRALS